MEKKTKNWMIGTLVILSLGIILLPFFQHEKDLAIEALSVKAPPFPGQSTQKL